eukprot:TRINITY_DN2804_c0_g2_i1.p1 TRINITY_DN2804_c0_g2~~TRINITY_DN2804_c0_g2_i1.p1  ORF type:complete len:450 (+),score=40.17 TRINITY_DN2804_c0_g2_i1:57-1406(+)
MKVKTIVRVEEQCSRECIGDHFRAPRNLDPVLHPLATQIEYKRALNAAKLNKVFAKPFICALPQGDGVYCLGKAPKGIQSIISGCGDGLLSVWDLASQRELKKLVGHKGIVRGVAVNPDGDAAVSCGDDCSVKLWKVPFSPIEQGPVSCQDFPIAEFKGKFAFRGIDHHWNESIFATAGARVDVWQHERSEPISSFEWGADTVVSVRFRPSEGEVFGSTGSDRSIALYDLRSGTPIRKIIMQTRSNSLAWNPMEPMNFVVANEDTNLYSYDMRHLDTAMCVHKDFTSAVMDVDFSPTGREFVAGSYDRTIRIFKKQGGHSRDIYHTKRMQRVFAVKFTMDGSYVVSGSDDMNVRLWKAEASKPLQKLNQRESNKQQYNEALLKQYGAFPEIKRIARHRHLPKPVYKMKQTQAEMRQSQKRKEDNLIAHSAPGSIQKKSERKKKIWAQLE